MSTLKEQLQFSLQHFRRMTLFDHERFAGKFSFLLPLVTASLLALLALGAFPPVFWAQNPVLFFWGAFALLALQTAGALYASWKGRLDSNLLMPPLACSLLIMLAALLSGSTTLLAPIVVILPAVCGIGLFIWHVLNARLEETRKKSLASKRYAALLETLGDFVTYHGAMGEVLDGDEEFLGEGFLSHVHEEDRPLYRAAFLQAFHEGSARIEGRFLGPDGKEWMVVETQIRALPHHPYLRGQLIAITRDITTQKTVLASLTSAREKAEAANTVKMRYFASMSHEMRTPLNAIIGFTEILNQGMFGKVECERYREYTRLIKESSAHILELVNDILDMAQIEAGCFTLNREEVDLAPVVEKCRQFMQGHAEKAGVMLTSTIDAHLPHAFVDQRACRQILLNLMCNAIKFSYKGGEVLCNLRSEGDHVHLSVRDHGIGIAPADLARIGSPFVRGAHPGQPRAEGWGLGLSVVKELTALHGGTMTIDSEPGKGTTVSIALPIAHGTKTKPAEAEEEAESMPYVQKVA